MSSVRTNKQDLVWCDVEETVYPNTTEPVVCLHLYLHHAFIVIRKQGEGKCFDSRRDDGEVKSVLNSTWHDVRQMIVLLAAADSLCNTVGHREKIRCNRMSTHVSPMCFMKHIAPALMKPTQFVHWIFRNHLSYWRLSQYKWSYHIAFTWDGDLILDCFIAVSGDGPHDSAEDEEDDQSHTYIRTL